MTERTYVPDRGDFVWLDFNPTSGSEQAGHRPPIVLTPKAYNGRTGLCVVCPATLRAKGYAFGVPNPSKQEPNSVIVADQIRTVDWRVRDIKFIHKVAPGILDQVVARIEALIINPEL
jgi:mRNA interferase MazF